MRASWDWWRASLTCPSSPWPWQSFPPACAGRLRGQASRRKVGRGGRRREERQAAAGSQAVAWLQLGRHPMMPPTRQIRPPASPAHQPCPLPRTHEVFDPLVQLLNRHPASQGWGASSAGQGRSGLDVGRAPHEARAVRCRLAVQPAAPQQAARPAPLTGPRCAPRGTPFPACNPYAYVRPRTRPGGRQAGMGAGRRAGRRVSRRASQQMRGEAGGALAAVRWRRQLRKQARPDTHPHTHPTPRALPKSASAAAHHARPQLVWQRLAAGGQLLEQRRRNRDVVAAAGGARGGGQCQAAPGRAGGQAAAAAGWWPGQQGPPSAHAPKLPTPLPPRHQPLTPPAPGFRPRCGRRPPSPWCRSCTAGVGRVGWDVDCGVGGGGRARSRNGCRLEQQVWRGLRRSLPHRPLQVTALAQPPRHLPPTHPPPHLFVVAVDALHAEHARVLRQGRGGGAGEMWVAGTQQPRASHEAPTRRLLNTVHAG